MVSFLTEAVADSRPTYWYNNVWLLAVPMLHTKTILLTFKHTNNTYIYINKIWVLPVHCLEKSHFSHGKMSALSMMEIVFSDLYICDAVIGYFVYRCSGLDEKFSLVLCMHKKRNLFLFRPMWLNYLYMIHMNKLLNI